MEEATRPATAHDLDVLLALHEVALQEIGDSKGGSMYLRREARHNHDWSLADWIDSAEHFVHVGTIDDVIVGYATARTQTLPDSTRIAEAIEIYVLPDARSVGVGEFMLDAMMAWGREKSCFRLEGSVLPGNRAGKNFFERAAMVTRLLRVSTELGTD